MEHIAHDLIHDVRVLSPEDNGRGSTPPLSRSHTVSLRTRNTTRLTQRTSAA